MNLTRMVSAVLPSFIVDEVRARRWREEQARIAIRAAREEAEASVREAARHIASWDDACDRAGGYDFNWLTQFRIARARLHVPDGNLLAATPLGVVARLVAKEDAVITDFGGATGELGADFLRAWPRAAYCVVENPAMVAHMQAEGLWPGVRFSAEVPARCDIFYASGALQYLADPMPVWEHGLKSARHAPVLRRTYFTPMERFDVQTSHLFDNGNGPLPEGFANIAVAYPRRSLDETQVRAIAQQQGFDCIANLEEPGDAVPDSYGRQLIFLRRRKPSVMARLTRRLKRLRPN